MRKTTCIFWSPQWKHQEVSGRNTCTFELIQSHEILNILKEKNVRAPISRRAADFFFMSKLQGRTLCLVVLHWLWAYTKQRCTLFFPISLNFSPSKAICKISQQLIFGNHWTTVTGVTSKWDIIYPLPPLHCTVGQNINKSEKHPGSRQKCKSLGRAH